ncbi:MAG: APC family permease [Steroidobacteraceae bacterium]
MSRPSEDAPHLRRTLGRWDVALMFVSGLVSLNTMAPLVQNGPMVLWLWPLAILFFFVPEAITVIELSRHFPGEGAVYVWPSRLLGEMHGFLSGWCYWMANIVYVPTLVVSSVGLAAYMFGASGNALATHGVAIEVGSFGLLALLIWLNIRGLAAEKLLVNVAALGTFTVGIILIGLTAWLALRPGVPVARLVWRPSGFDWHLISVFSLLCFSLLGLEIASNVGDEIRDPRQTLPRALLMGAALVAALDVLLTISMLLAAPPEGVDAVQGVLEAVNGQARRAGAGSLAPAIAGLLALSVAGTAAAWLAAPARIPYVAALEGHLPRVFARLHPRYASPHIALLLCGGLCALALYLSFAGAGLNEAFLTILDLSVILSLLQYLYMYSSLLALVFRRRDLDLYFSRRTLAASGITGICVTLLATVCALVPTRQVEHLGLFEGKIFGFCAIVLGSGVLCFRLNSRSTPSRT